MSRGTKNSSCSRPKLHTAPSTSKFMRPKSFLHSFDIAEVARGRGVFSKILAEDPGYKKGWDKDGVAAKENRRHGIDREVCSWDRPGSVRRAHAAVRVRRAVRLAVEKILALKLPDGGHVVVKLEERSLDLRGLCPCLNAEAIGCSRRMRTWIWLRCGSVEARMASGCIWNARWGLEQACAHHLQAERSGAEARGKVAGG